MAWPSCLLKAAATLLPFLALADFNIGKNFIDFHLTEIEDNSEDPIAPSITIHFWAALIARDSGWGRMPLAGNETVLRKLCVGPLWHLWIAYDYPATSWGAKHEEEEWFPTLCKMPSPKPPGDPTFKDTDYPQKDLRMLIPIGLLAVAPTPPHFKVRRDLTPYTPETNKVCSKNHHFFIQENSTKAEGIGEVVNGVNPRGMATAVIPKVLTDFFANDIDLCAFFRHPCWCERAPPEYNCDYCQMTESFDSQWLCYGKDHPNKDWCTAVTVEKYPTEPKPNRAIKPEEYEELLALREAGSLELAGRSIVWLDELAEAEASFD